jgi:glycine betaine/proline transport system ATP-binding protein
MQDEFLRLQAMLKKTIVFITHDFDEAIRLADRIAIMKDGAVDQFGTAEEIVTNPATDYVREFTKEISRDKLLTVRSVMQPANDAGASDLGVNAGDKLSVAAEKILRHDDPVAVLEEGKPVGVITREDVIQALHGQSG